MKSISFGNPYLLLLAIPLLLAIIIPFAIAIRKDNRTKSVIISFILHIVMVACVTLAAAQTISTTVMTETNVYVVVDLSYSAKSNLDLIDEHIRTVEKELPRNSKMGVIAFGRDQKVLCGMGKDFESVKGVRVDESATDIASALNYTAAQFEDDVIKRIVLISDGKETGVTSSDGLIEAIENLHIKNIYLDAIYVDNNISENTREVQISEVDFTEHTYEGHETTADVLVQTNRNEKAILTLYKNEEKLDEQSVELTKGYNIVNFLLDTSEAGNFDYRVEVKAEGDSNVENNGYTFTQEVAGQVNVLLVSTHQEDVAKVQSLYGEEAVVDSYINDPALSGLKRNEVDALEAEYAEKGLKVRLQTADVPFSIEEICVYDEIILSDTDVRELNNYTAFVDSLDKAVSLFGKSLLTFGDTQIQNRTEEDEVLSTLDNMLPVKFGNNEGDPKMVAIVLDMSNSMQFSYQFQFLVAKKAAIQVLNLLADTDYVMLAPFSGDVTVAQIPTPAKNRDAITEIINAIAPSQGTLIGKALEATYEHIKDLPYSKKEVILISDGLTYSAEEETAQDWAITMKDAGITTSTFYVYSPKEEDSALLQEVATLGGGKYYKLTQDNVDDVLLNEVSGELQETVIEQTSAVTLVRRSDETLQGVNSLPEVSGFVFSKAKASATTVLTAEYVKPSGKTSEAPIYAHWEYGSGKVASFTTTLSGGWTSSWQTSERSQQFFSNVLNVNVPSERKDAPYTLSVDYDGVETGIEIVPVKLNPYATTSLKITRPNGEVEEVECAFDTRMYSYRFETPTIGKYSVEISYSYDGKTYISTARFDVPYYGEYDSFAAHDISNLRDAVRNRGNVYENGKDLRLVNDEKEVATYEIDYTVALLIAAVALYVVDIVIRKLKWEDIRMLFKRRNKRKGG